MTTKRKKHRLTKYEREIEASMRRGEWVEGPPELRPLIEDAAGRALEAGGRKEARINIRLAPQTLDLVRSAAAKEGIPYQTLIASILHKAVTGQFVTRQQWQELLDQIKR